MQLCKFLEYVARYGWLLIHESMLSLPFFQVDAFTNTPLNGNPCAVILDADSLTSQTMQAIAREQNLSETAFILQSTRADVRARYFTPSEEIPLAGHPTIAAIHLLAETNRIRLNGARTTISLELQAGIVSVEILTTDEHTREIIMTQLTPQFLCRPPQEKVLAAFGLSTKDLILDHPIQVVSTGTPQLMVPLRNTENLAKIRIDVELLAQLRQEFDFFSTHLFAVTNAETYARHFSSPPDLFEDPFTGSATGAMGAYLWHYHLIDEPNFTAHQGIWMKRPGQGQVRVHGSRSDISSVQVSGQAVTVISGTLCI